MPASTTVVVVIVIVVVVPRAIAPPRGGARARAMVWGTTEAEATYTPQSINQPTYKLRKRLETSKAYGHLSISSIQKVSSVDGRWRIEL